MHRRLRRQLQQHLGQELQRSPPLQRLLLEIDGEYQRADLDRQALQKSLELLADLTRRKAEGEQGRPARPVGVGKLARGLFAGAPFPALLCDGGLAVQAWNRAAERHFGWRAAEVVGRTIPEVLFAEADRAAVGRELARVLHLGETEQSLRVGTARTGEAHLDEWTVVPLVDRAGVLSGAAVLMRETFSASNRYVAAWRGSGDGLYDWDLGTGKLWTSDTFHALIGVASPRGEPNDWLERIHPQDREAFDEALRAHLEGPAQVFECEHRLAQAGDSPRWVLARGRAARDVAGKAIRLSGAVTDVTARRLVTDRALREALHDPLTGLPTRAFFLDLVKRSFARTRRREGYGFGVMFLDLDQFKAVNDGLGHAAGDDLLIQMSARLQTCLREGDSLARHGGDEFTILVDDIKEPGEATIVADRIHEATSRPFEVAGQEVYVTTSIGIALSSPFSSRPEDLLLDADTAMYRSKAQGRARTVVFDPTTPARSPEAIQLETDLRHALVRSEFRVHYLPLVDVASGDITGLEALIRWAHPKRGLVPPDQFVAFAEETGLIVPIGRWLLDHTSREFQRFRQAAASRPLRLHVNFSSKQLLNADLLEQLDSAARGHQLNPKDLAVELTEHTYRQGEPTARRIAALRERGVRLCMDDFGAGFSSLTSLHRFELDELKIDRSLFTGGGPHGRAPDLVRSIVSLARDMGKRVVAEGIETAEQYRFLREVGCASAQGFFFSPPVEFEQARHMVASGSTW